MIQHFLEGKGAQSEEERACARIFQQLSNPREIPFVLMLMETVQIPHIQSFSAWPKKDRKQSLCFYAKTHCAYKGGEAIPPEVALIKG